MFSCLDLQCVFILFSRVVEVVEILGKSRSESVWSNNAEIWVTLVAVQLSRGFGMHVIFMQPTF